MLLPLLFVYIEVTSFTINDVGQIALDHLDQIALVPMVSEMLVPLDEVDIYVAELTMCLASICVPSEHRPEHLAYTPECIWQGV